MCCKPPKTTTTAEEASSSSPPPPGHLHGRSAAASHDDDDDSDDSFVRILPDSSRDDDDDEPPPPTDLFFLPPQKPFDWDHVVAIFKSSTNFCEPPPPPAASTSPHPLLVGDAPRARAVTADSETSLMKNNNIDINNNNNNSPEDLLANAIKSIQQNFLSFSTTKRSRTCPTESLEDWEKTVKPMEEEEMKEDEEEEATALIVSVFDGNNVSPLLAGLENFLTVVLILGFVYRLLLQLGLRVEYVLLDNESP